MKYLSVFFMLFGVIMSCNTGTNIRVDKVNTGFYHIIPKPVSIIDLKGSFHVNENTRFAYSEFNDDIRIFMELMNPILPFSLEGEVLKDTSESNTINFIIDDKINEEEGYILEISKNFINIKAKTYAGIFYGVQTLIQIIEFDTKNNKIPALVITDFPRFKYRGLHLDVCRHFFPPEFVKKYIDLMSRYKFNRFHWHLTEDQGWRIEIKKYPKLTEIGAYRDSTLIGRYSDMPHKFDKTRYGGFYTQEEIKDIVKYAAEKHITIIPEIEMPGHSRAALAAYPELACTEGPFSVMPIWGVSKDIYCPTEKTFKFLEDVLSEVMELFPSEYIHIGGDEVPKARWKESEFCQNLIKKEGLKDENELQSYFIQRIEKFVNSKGKKIIGWDEILEGGLAPNATVMSWRGEKGGIEAAKQHHDVVMTPGNYCYFDHYQSLDKDEPLAIGGYTPIEEVYSYNPVPKELSEEEAKYIIGAQGNMWTEYIPTPELVEYMVYPRAIALSEVVWTPQKLRNYEDFVKRLIPHMEKLKKEGVNVANHLGDISAKFENTGVGVKMTLKNSLPQSKIYYSLDGKIPDSTYPAYMKPIEIKNDAKIKAVTYYKGKRNGPVFSRKIKMHKAAGKFIKLKNKPSPRYSKGGANSVINGIMGSDVRYADDQWLGFNGDDFEGVIDLGNNMYITKIKMRFYNRKGAWIYPPEEIEIYSSNDGYNYRIAGAIKIKSKNKAHLMYVPIRLLKNTNTRYLKIIAKNHGIIEEGAPGSGHPAWLFVDEIVVE